MNIYKRSFRIAVFFALALSVSFTPGFAAPAAFALGVDFSDAAFQAALESGKPVLLDFHADWCPTCRKQSKALEQILAEEKFQGITVFVVDYDNADALEKKYGVHRQSTLILFKEKKELDRTFGTYEPEPLREFLSKAL